MYDHPATPFVMRFLVPVTTVDGQLVRPHDLQVATEGWPGSVPVVVTRVATLGFEVRVETRAEDGSPAWAQLTRGQATELDLHPGDTVHIGATAGARTPVLS